MKLTASMPARPNSNWQPLDDPALPPGLTVWSIDLDSAPADFGLLSAEELSRAGSFRFEIHQRRFVAGRAALRRKLGELAGTPPEKLRFATNAFGKPRLAGPALRFNLAHSENRAVLAVASFEVGIDLEHERAVEFDQIAREICSPEELGVWNTFSLVSKPPNFFRLWTRKEALLKGVGCGISENTRRVSVFFDPQAPVSSEAVTDGAWSVRSFQAGDGLPAAVAWDARTDGP